MYTRLNNFLLVSLVTIGLIYMLVQWKSLNRSAFLNRSWPVLVFFGLSILAAFRTFNVQSFKLLENHWSLLFVPIVMLVNNNLYHEYRRKAFLSLLWGCIVTLSICNFNHFYQMASLKVPLNQWFLPSHFGHGFTEIADTHPAYLSLFVVTSILFLIQDRGFSKLLKYFLLILLLFGLVQLTSKIALILFLLFLLYVAVDRIKKHRRQSTVLVIGLVTCALAFLLFGSNYVQNRMFFVDTIFDEKRIERWEVSYEIFKENPFLGVGYGKINEERKRKYLEGNYPLAAERDLNAHNQFLEFLSIDGALGGFGYAISLGFLFLLSIKSRDHLFTFVFFAFILGNLTESMMVRIKGIEYFAIFASLFLCSQKSREEFINSSEFRNWSNDGNELKAM